MLVKLRHAAIAAALSAAVALPAAAQDVILEFDRDGPRLRLDDDDRRYPEARRVRRDCGPERALEKAERFGLRRARVSRVGARSIEVRGRLDGERVVMTIGRSRGCPILDY